MGPHGREKAWLHKQLFVILRALSFLSFRCELGIFSFDVARFGDPSYAEPVKTSGI